ncbi:MAG TPA: fibronectin type III domain-containing protein [Steroidobacteraceae bacterium]|jgi:hypothetical protein
MYTRQISWGCALLLTMVGAASAQTAGVVNLTASPTSGTGSVTPKLTWSTNPVATSCTASGGWSGTKAASGSQTLTAIKANTNFTLTCTWGGSGSATVNWTPPTKNTDGSALTNLASYKILYGTSSTSLTKTKTIDDPTARSASVTSLTPATWYFTVRSVTTGGVESANSNVASKAVKGASAAKTVTVSVTPSSGSRLTTKATNVWDVVRRSDGTWVRSTVVASIPLGKPCYSWFKVSDKHYLINRNDVTKFYYKPKSTNLVVNCIGD